MPPAPYFVLLFLLRNATTEGRNHSRIANPPAQRSQDEASGIEVIASEWGHTSNSPYGPGASAKFRNKLEWSSNTLMPRSSTHEVTAFHSLTPFETLLLIWKGVP